MGCVDSKTGGSRDQVGPEKPISKRFTLSYSNRSPEPAVSMVIPGLVQCLTITKKPDVPSVCFSWEPPANMMEMGEEVQQYEVKIAPASSSSLSASSYHHGSEVPVKDLIEVNGKETMIELSMAKHGLRPLRGYVFSVRAMSSQFSTGEWNDVEGFFDWHCRLPDCDVNRLELDDGSVYKFCSREHKIEYDETYCLHPDCTKPVIALSPPSSPATPTSPSSVCSATSMVLARDTDHFCSPDHFEYFLRKKNLDHPGMFFLNVEQDSQEFQNVESLFQKRWASKEKSCPSLTLVLAILNPALNKRFTDYAESRAPLKKDRKDLIKTFYFGTKLGCDLLTYQDLCINCSDFSKCGICNLSSEGFSKIVAPMIPLDKNPADAHFKTDPQEDSYMYALLMCDVVSGIAKRMSRKDSDISRPEGVDAVKVRSGSIMGHTENVRIYNADTVCPRYVLLFV